MLALAFAFGFAHDAVAQGLPAPPRWASVLESRFVEVHALEVGPDGPIVVGGSDGDLNVTAGVGIGSAFAFGDAFSLVYAAGHDGAPRWARSTSGDRPYVTYHVAAEGDLVVTGEGVPYRPHPFKWTTGTTRVVGRSGDGSVRWTVDLGAFVDDGEGPSQSSAVAYGLDLEGGVAYVGGVFRDTLVVGADTLVAAPDPDVGWFSFDVFVAAFDGATGAPLWARSVAAGPDAVSNVHDGRIVVGEGDGQGAFAAGPSGVLVGGVFPPGSVADASGERVVLEDETAVVRFGLDGAFDRAWTQADFEVRDDVIGEWDSVGDDPEGRNLAWPLAIDEGLDGGLVVVWRFIPGKTIGPRWSHIEAGGTTYTDTAGSGVLVTRHGESGALGWAVDIVTDGPFPSPGGIGRGVSLDVDRYGRVAVGATFSSNVVRVAGRSRIRDTYEDGLAVVVGPGGKVRRVVQLSDEPGTEASGSTTPRQGVTGVAFDDEGSSEALYLAGRVFGHFELGGAVYRNREERSTAGYVLRLDLGEAVSQEDNPSGDAFSISVGPNPTTSHVRVRPVGGRGAVAVRVLDALGREVARTEGTAGANLDASAWPAGVYVVEATDAATGVRASSAVTVVR
ncbi:T9SS type A sorting domain-containing protein [Rubrivirga sp.]|uniref:T9SS type A sorting domain-containing protein n=1 Tax=Rubrivirga sp. TaxID=1885344 RepID=UPI003C744F75